MYWVLADRFNIIDCGFTPRLRREIRQIIFEHFEQIVFAWRGYFGEEDANKDQSTAGNGN